MFRLFSYTKNLILISSALPICISFEAYGQTPVEDKVLSLERNIAAAFSSADVEFLEMALADDLVYTHGDQWTTGGEPNLVEDKQQTISRMAKIYSREIDSQRIELHGPIAITTGRIKVKGQRKYSLWYLRVYREGEPGWQLVTHRTVKLIWED